MSPMTHRQGSRDATLLQQGLGAVNIECDSFQQRHALQQSTLDVCPVVRPHPLRGDGVCVVPHPLIVATNERF